MTRETDAQRKRSLECLRLAADFQNLAWDGATPEEIRSLLTMAQFWTDLADPKEAFLFKDDRQPWAED